MKLSDAAKCLETREPYDGMRRRRYLLPDGRRFTTYEVPAAVLMGSAPMKKLLARLDSFQRAEQTRARRVVVERQLAQGVKPLAIADEVGMTAANVQKIRRQKQST